MSHCYLHKYICIIKLQSSKILCQFRLNNTRLPIITGRYTGIFLGNKEYVIYVIQGEEGMNVIYF